MARSNFSETKEAIESMFIDSWTTTSVHYTGMNFNSENLDEWVNVVYEPRGANTLGLSSGSTSTSTYGAIYVVCWAEDNFSAFGLSDTVVSFVGVNMPSEISNLDYSVIDQGFDPNNKAFIVLEFPIKSYLECTDR